MTDFNSYGEEPMVGLQPLFFRVADRMRLEGYVAALVDDNMSLSMVSGHDAILDHYGKLLVARLREAAPHIGLEVYFPASADALITRFNEVLQTYSIEDAMGNKAPGAQPKIWIVHDASSLPDHEIQLLARLVQHFPVANIRVVMLLTTASKKQRLLASFGRRILNWEIEPPSDEQAQLMLEQARAQGREGAVGALLKKIAPWSKPPAQMQTQALPASASAVDTEPAVPASQATPATPSTGTTAGLKAQSTPASVRKWLPWLAGTVALMGICALVVLSLYGGSSKIDWMAWTTRQVEVAPPPLNASSTPTGQSAAPAAAPDASGVSVATTASVPGTPANALGESTSGANLSQAKTADPVAPVASANAPRGPAAAPANEVEEIISTPSQSQVGQAWVRQMPPGSFLIQHTVVPSYAEATLWLQARSNLRRARILAIYPEGQGSAQFAIVSGPFTSIAEASAYAANNALPKDRQIRSARAVKERFAP